MRALRIYGALMQRLHAKPLRSLSDLITAAHPPHFVSHRKARDALLRFAHRSGSSHGLDGSQCRCTFVDRRCSGRACGTERGAPRRSRSPVRDGRRNDGCHTLASPCGARGCCCRRSRGFGRGAQSRPRGSGGMTHIQSSMPGVVRVHEWHRAESTHTQRRTTSGPTLGLGPRPVARNGQCFREGMRPPFAGPAQRCATSGPTLGLGPRPVARNGLSSASGAVPAVPGKGSVRRLVAQPCMEHGTAVPGPHEPAWLPAGWDSKRCGRRLATGTPRRQRCLVSPYFWLEVGAASRLLQFSKPCSVALAVFAVRLGARPNMFRPGRGLRSWREHQVLRPDGLGSSFCARCGRSANSAVMLERCLCEATERWLSQVVSAVRAGCSTHA